MILAARLASWAPIPAHTRRTSTGFVEYRHVDDDQWRAGRTAVLHRFLDRQRLVITPHAHHARAPGAPTSKLSCQHCARND